LVGTDTRAFCYSNADLRREDRVFRFVSFWEKPTRHPRHLVFDSAVHLRPARLDIMHIGSHLEAVARTSKS
jgi:hypothetical protein